MNLFDQYEAVLSRVIKNFQFGSNYAKLLPSVDLDTANIEFSYDRSVSIIETCI